MNQKKLKSLLRYDPETGLFTWLVCLSNRAPIGKVVGDGKSVDDYVLVSIQGKRYLAHRLAVLYMIGRWPTKDVDHKNGRKNDNRWRNLRPATNAENHRNIGVRSNNTSGITGVTWDSSRERWKVHIKADGKFMNLGRYRSFTKAWTVRVLAEHVYFGEFKHAVNNP